jgi:hypothetical protein
MVLPLPEGRGQRSAVMSDVRCFLRSGGVVPLVYGGERNNDWGY